MKSLKAVVLFFLIVFSISKSFAQISIPGQPSEVIDKLNDSTTLTLYTSILGNSSKKFEFLDPLLKFSYNSKYPRGYNDGPIWKGKAFTIESHAGFQGSVGKFSYTFLPAIFYSQNQSVAIGGEISFNYPFSNRIDWVQRYGADPFVRINPGQSEIKFQHRKFVTAISTQNYSLGPSVYNPIILSRQASGFPHLRLGITPTEIKIKNTNFGKIETNFIFGLLDESEYYDDDETNDQRYINILALGYSPSFAPQLTIGLNRVLYKQTRFFEAQDLFSTIYVADDGVINDSTQLPNDAFDQMASITMDWKFPKVGFRAYMEFAKNDFTSNGSGLRPTLVEPEHTRAFTAGFEKDFITKKGRTVRFGYEHTTLSRSQDPWRATPTYYTHSVNRNGYSHDGQIIGAGIGPGGNSDHLSIRAIYSSFSAGVLLQRIEHNRDFFVDNVRDFFKHDIEYTINTWLTFQVQSFVFYGEGAISQNYNKYYVIDKLNISFGLGVKYLID